MAHMVPSSYFASTLPSEVVRAREHSHAARDSIMSSPPRSPSSSPGLNDYAGDVILGSGRCLKCNAQGHWVKDCPLATCFHCRKKGHIMDDCSDKVNIQCYGCSKFGHLRKDCLKNEDDASGIAAQEELRKTRQTLQDTQEQLRRAQQEIGLLHEDLKEANDKHERWRAFTQSTTGNICAAPKMQCLHKDLRYTQLRRVDPSAAKAQLQNYAQYVEKLFDQDSYHLYLTINMLVYEIDYFKVKESDGGLILRYDAALTLATLLEGALEKYGYREAWDRNILRALNAADVQLSRIIIDIYGIFGNEVNLKSAQVQLVDGDCELAATHGFDEYYPKSIRSVEECIGFFGRWFE